MGEDGEANILMGVSEAAYTLWESGKDRYVVTLGRQASPVLGYVRQNADELWITERAGKILPSLHRTADDAAKALVGQGNAETRRPDQRRS
jgi:hypothetical protein